ncbi:Gag polyprotein [Bienertia sinuspersici]
MAEELVEGWKKFKLTEEEDEEIDLDVLPDDEMQTQIELALVGKLFTNSSFNIEAMKNVLRASWKPIKGMTVREIDKNLFVFQFFNHLDKEKVINQSPWAFDNHLLLLREISGREQPKDLSFDSVDFWVRVYNVPFAKRSKSLASTIGNKMGNFLEYDDSDISGWSKFMRIRVRMNVLKPLPRGVTMRIRGEKIWVDFWFERLPGFCLICGQLGHIARECEDFDKDIPENELPYGSWLRASPLRMRPRSGGMHRDHENKLFQDLRGPNNAKKKLKFAHDNPIPFLEDAAKASKEGLHDSMGGEIGSTSNM